MRKSILVLMVVSLSLLVASYAIAAGLNMEEGLWQITMSMECNSPEGKIVINGRATYRGTTFNGIVKVKQADMEITQKMNGKWIGKCK